MAGSITDSAAAAPTALADDGLSGRVRAALVEEPVEAKRMFGGVTFMLNGHMLCAVSRRGLMVRVGPEAEPAALRSPFAARCTGSGRTIPGFLMVVPDGVRTEVDLLTWLGLAVDYVGSLPPKKGRGDGRRQAKVRH